MSSSESEEEDYEVERITGHRKQDGEYVFKVRWKGYDKDQDTWEPQSNLDNCQQAIDDYWARRNAEKEKKKLEEAAASGIAPPVKPPSSTESKPLKEVSASSNETSATTKEIEKPRSKSPEKLAILKEKISAVKAAEKEKELVKENATAATNDKGKEKEAPKLGDMPMTSSAEKTESWATDTVKFTTGVDLKRPAPMPKDPLKPKLETKVEPELKAKPKIMTPIDSSDAGSIESAKISNATTDMPKPAKKAKLISDVPTVKKKQTASSGAGGSSSGGPDYKVRFENLKKDYEKLKKNYEKLNEANKVMKAKVEKATVDTKEEGIDTSDVYQNGSQAFIEVHRKPMEVLWEGVKTGNLHVVGEAVYSMGIKDSCFHWDVQDTNGKTMLICATEKEDEEMVKLLLSCPYLDVNARSNEEGATALIIACDLGFLNIASLLLEAGAHVNKITVINGESALMKAAKNGHDEIVRLLLEYCADTNLKTELNQIAQQMARLKNHQTVVKLIEQQYSWIKNAIDEKIKLYLRDSYDIGTTPLFPMHCHSIKESAVVNFTVDMANTSSTPANNGGYLLFLAHCKIEPRRNNIMARLHGPCFVQQVRMNTQVLHAPTPGANYILGFIPKVGKNQLQITFVHAPWSDTKLVVCAYAVTKKKINVVGTSGFSTVAAMGAGSFRSTLPK